MMHDNEKLLTQENNGLDLNELLGSMDGEPASAPGELPELSEADMFGEDAPAQVEVPQDVPDGTVSAETGQNPPPKPKKTTRKKSRRSLLTTLIPPVLCRIPATWPRRLRLPLLILIQKSPWRNLPVLLRQKRGRLFPHRETLLNWKQSLKLNLPMLPV